MAKYGPRDDVFDPERTETYGSWLREYTILMNQIRDDAKVLADAKNREAMHRAVAEELLRTARQMSVAVVEAPRTGLPPPEIVPNEPVQTPLPFKVTQNGRNGGRKLKAH